MFRSSTSPRSTRSSLQTSSSTVSPSAEIVSLYQRAAPAASSVPGTREGNWVEFGRDCGRDGGVEQRIEGRPRQCSRCRDREQERQCCRRDDERADPDEARVERSRDGTPPPSPLRASRFHRGAIVSGQAARRARPRFDAERLDHSPRRRRGIDSDPPHVPARARRLPRRPGARRRGGAAPFWRGGRRPRGSRRDAPTDRRPRSVQAAAQPEQRPDHHADRAGRSSTRSSGSSSAPTTTSPSRSPSESSGAACVLSCDELPRRTSGASAWRSSSAET